MTIGSKIKQIRKERGYTQKDLSEKIGIDAATLRKYENGQMLPKISTIEKIAKELNVEPSSITASNIPDLFCAMHSLFNIFEMCDGSFHIIEDGDKPVYSLSFELLNPLIAEWYKQYEHSRNLTLDGVSNSFGYHQFIDSYPSSSSFPPEYISYLKKYSNVFQK